MPAWSVPAAMGAARATIVIPSLFVLCSKVIGDPQMTIYATFGGFAILAVGGFGGPGGASSRPTPALRSSAASC